MVQGTPGVGDLRTLYPMTTKTHGWTSISGAVAGTQGMKSVE